MVSRKSKQTPSQGDLIEEPKLRTNPFAAQSLVFRTAASALGSLLEMQNLRPQPRPTESTLQDPQIIYTHAKVSEALM